MTSIRKTIFTTFVLALLTAGMATSGMAQFGANDASIRDVVRRIQTRTDSLQRAVQNAADRNNYRVDDINRMILDFEAAANQLDRRLGSRRASSADAQRLLDLGAQIDNFFMSNRLGAGSNREWQALRADLDQLASYYNLSTRWGTSSGSVGNVGDSNYNLSDMQLRQLIDRLNVRSATFSRTLRQDLNRGDYNNRSRLDEVRQHLSDFETALVQLRNRVNSRQSTSADVQNVLDHAAYLNNYITNRQLSYQTANNWSTLRSDLDRLASAYNIAWNWSTSTFPNGPTGPNGGSGTRGDLTGTFRLNPSRGDDARRAVDNATRNLSQAERQQVSDALLRRLDPPQMLAIDRRGNSVTIASTRAPQINFTADGREQVETTPQGRSVRVRASFSGDTLTITRTGERANDFTVTFDPSDAGRELLVTRTLYSDRFTQPIVVRTYYDRTSDVAQLNIYDTNPEAGNVGTTTPTGTFVIPNGTEVVAVLNNDLSTQNVREGERFTMTVRSPSQYEGATIEGSVINVSRGGRVSGRSEMTLDFDTIRLRDGRSYRFAGILESVRTASGDVVRVDNEGAVRDTDQTKTTVQRTAIGTAVGAIIGAIAGGGKGAAIGAIIGAGAGAGSVYVQGRNDLDLNAGTEVTLRATGPRG
ncbi:MAG TPA: YMGG-like glycine zipper-containing protein [Pyrinomonadaceae bacterium]|nr:YMGG-like glycine zipper-containing protein [Pyrinomonadaceae bacterium]